MNNKAIKLPFKVSARAGKLLGRENFSNPEGAIIELVKNSYDADAENCLVIFDIPIIEKQDEYGKKFYAPIKEKGVIYIIDNGEGMEAEIIENYWMQIGTGNKEEFYLSDKKRVKNGAKGIGRFALDRLGLRTEMWTLSEKNRDGMGFYWEMDWSQFDNLNKTISDIEVDLSYTSLDIKSKITELIGNNLINDEVKSFDFKHGTILKISNLKDDWHSSEVKGVYTTLESLIPPKELNIPFKVYFKHKQDFNLYGNVNTAFLMISIIK